MAIHSSGIVINRFQGSFGEAVLDAVEESPDAYVYLATLDGAYHPHDIRRACEYQVKHNGDRSQFLTAFLENTLPFVNAQTMADILASIGTGDEIEEWFPNFSAFSLHRRQPKPTSFIQLPQAASENWVSQKPGQEALFSPEDLGQWMEANDCLKIVAYSEFVGVIQFSNGDTGVSHERYA